MDILDISIEGLFASFDSYAYLEDSKVGDSIQNIKFEISRIKIEDLQKEQNKDSKGNWKGNGPATRRVIPECYSLILSNPDREGTWKDDIVKAFSRANKNDIKQFELSANIENRNLTEDFNQIIKGSFIFRTLKLVVTVPIIERLLSFLEKIKKVQHRFEQRK